MTNWIETIGLNEKSIQKLKDAKITSFDDVGQMTWYESTQLLERPQAWILREAYDPILPNADVTES